MKAFVFKPTNAYIGRFDVGVIGEIPDAFAAFANDHEVFPYVYVECDGHTWTLLEGDEGLHLVEGRVDPWKSEPDGDAGASAGPEAAMASRYAGSYTAAETIKRIGTVVKVVGLVLGFALVFMGAIVSDQLGAAAFFMAVLHGTVCAALFYVAGVVLCILGHILNATLDSAVHSSPFLSEERKRLVIDNQR